MSDNKGLLKVFEKFGKHLVKDGANIVDKVTLASNSNGINLKALLVSTDMTKQQQGKSGFMVKYELFLFDISKVMISNDCGERVDENTLKLCIKKKVQMTEDEKANCKDPNRKYNYVDTGEYRILRTYSTVKVSMYCASSNAQTDKNYATYKKSNPFDLVEVHGLRPIRIDNKSKNGDNELTITNVSSVIRLPHEFSPYHTISSICPRFPFDHIPPLLTKPPSSEEVHEFVIEHYNGDMDKVKAARNRIWYNKMTAEERRLYSGTFFFSTMPHSKKQVESMSLDKGHIQLPTIYNSFHSDGPVDQSTNEKTIKRVIKGMINAFQWNNDYNISYENPEAFYIAFQIPDEAAMKLLQIADEDVWKVIAPIHIPKLPVWMLGWIDAADTSEKQGLLEDANYKFGFKFVCKEACSDLLRYLVVIGGLQVSFEYIRERCGVQDTEAFFQSEEVSDNIKDKQQSMQNIHQGILNFNEKSECFISSTDNTKLYYVLNNIDMNEEQMKIYNSWKEDRARIMSEVLMGRDEDHRKELGIELPPSKDYKEVIYVVAKKRVEQMANYLKKRAGAKAPQPLKLLADTEQEPKNASQKRVRETTNSKDPQEQLEKEKGDVSPKRQRTTPVEEVEEQKEPNGLEEPQEQEDDASNMDSDNDSDIEEEEDE